MVYKMMFATVLDGLVVVSALGAFLLLIGLFRKDRFVRGLLVGLPVLILCRIGVTLLGLYDFPRMVGVLCFWMSLVLCLVLAISAARNGMTRSTANG